MRISKVHTARQLAQPPISHDEGLIHVYPSNPWTTIEFGGQVITDEERLFETCRRYAGDLVAAETVSHEHAHRHAAEVVGLEFSHYALFTTRHSRATTGYEAKTILSGGVVIARLPFVTVLLAPPIPSKTDISRARRLGFTTPRNLIDQINRWNNLFDPLLPIPPMCLATHP